MSEASSSNPALALRADWVVQRLKRLMETPEVASLPLELEKFLSEIANQTSKISFLSATEVSVERLASLFQLSIPGPYNFRKYDYKPSSEPLEVPRWLAGSTDRETGPGMGKSNIGVQCLVTVCKWLMKNYPHAHNPQPPQSPHGATPTEHPIRMIPQLELNVTVTEQTTMESVELRGRADWGIAYGNCADLASLFVVIEAKHPTQFSSVYPQLLAYLAIIRERRIREKKQNAIAQGFFTDGSQHCFVMIDSDGCVRQSRPYHVFVPSELKTIVNFVSEMLDTAMKYSPHSAPTQNEEVCRREVSAHRQWWGKSFVGREDNAVVTEEDGYHLLPMED